MLSAPAKPAMVRATLRMRSWARALNPHISPGQISGPTPRGGTGVVMNYQTPLVIEETCLPLRRRRGQSIKASRPIAAT